MSEPTAPSTYLELQDLFHESRLDRANMGPLQWALLILWFPFGCLLAVLRLFGSLFVTILTPPRWRTFTVHWVMGILHRPRGEPIAVPEKGAVLVANHMAYTDIWPVQRMISNFKSAAVLIWYKVNVLNKIGGRPYILVYGRGKNRDLQRRIKEYLKTGNVLILPEGAVTDGHRGLLLFQRMAFELEAPVYAFSVKWRRALPFLRPSALSPHLFFEMMLDFFQPWMISEPRALGKFEKRQGEDSEEFAARVQDVIADDLDLIPTDHTRTTRHSHMEITGRLPSQNPKAPSGPSGPS